ncbi:MAG: N-acetylmuramoyl-L-alanine amidase [Nanoarchaeota archaeon]
MNRRDSLRLLAALPFLDLESLASSFLERRSARILINPGHNKDSNNSKKLRFLPDVGYEYDINTQIAQKLQQELKHASPSGLEVILSRNKTDYIDQFQLYFSQHKSDFEDEVRNYRISHKGHTDISLQEAALQLALIRWAETNADLVVNVHINFYSEKDKLRRASGFSVVFSDISQYPKENEGIALRIHKSLEGSFAPSNSKWERLTINDGTSSRTVPGLMMKHLVMIGSELHTVQIPSVIVECGYLGQKYEGRKTIADEWVQRRYAGQIAKGVLDYLSHH